MAVTKVATCCYCGTKAALVLRGDARHELSCGNCGAPLHAMKALKQTETPTQTSKAVSHKPKPRKYDDAVKPGKRKKRKSFKRKVWNEVWDALEDIFD